MKNNKAEIKEAINYKATYSSTYAIPMSFVEFLKGKGYVNKCVGNGIEYELDSILGNWEKILTEYWHKVYLETEYENKYERNIKTIFDLVDLKTITKFVKGVYEDVFGISYEKVYIYIIMFISNWETWLFEEWKEIYLKSKGRQRFKEENYDLYLY